MSDEQQTSDERDLRMCRTVLTPEQHHAKALALAQELTSRDRLEAQAKEVASGYRDQLKKLTERVSELQRDVQEGTEERPVECYEDWEYRQGIVYTRRCDTKEAVDSRAMTMAERQENLDFAAKAKGGKNGKGPKIVDEPREEPMPGPRMLPAGAVEEDPGPWVRVDPDDPDAIRVGDIWATRRTKAEDPRNGWPIARVSKIMGADAVELVHGATRARLAVGCSPVDGKLTVDVAEFDVHPKSTRFKNRHTEVSHTALRQRFARLARA